MPPAKSCLQNHSRPPTSASFASLDSSALSHPLETDPTEPFQVLNMPVPHNGSLRVYALTSNAKLLVIFFGDPSSGLGTC